MKEWKDHSLMRHVVYIGTRGDQHIEGVIVDPVDKRGNSSCALWVLWDDYKEAPLLTSTRSMRHNSMKWFINYAANIALIPETKGSDSSVALIRNEHGVFLQSKIVSSVTGERLIKRTKINDLSHLSSDDMMIEYARKNVIETEQELIAHNREREARRISDA